MFFPKVYSSFTKYGVDYNATHMFKLVNQQQIGEDIFLFCLFVCFEGGEEGEELLSFQLKI